MTHQILIMGVSGTGKTTIAKLLVEKLKLPFLEADDFHPEANILKMANGQPLNDDDRLPWLQNLALAGNRNSETGFVMTCSALKKSYRDILNSLIKNDLKIVFLNGSFELIKSRLENRKGHFMTSKLLKSQFDALEIPEDVWEFNIENSPQKIVEEIINKLSD